MTGEFFLRPTPTVSQRMVIDFHIHTRHSYDSSMDPARILSVAKSRGLTGIVVCDHGTLRGGLECQELNRDPEFLVLVGAEIATDAGDLIGFPIRSEIGARRFGDVAREIHEQGGLVLLPHPFKAHGLDRVDFGSVDLIEGRNARLPAALNEKALKLAADRGIPAVAGSDAHLYSEIGNGRTFFDSRDLLNPTHVSCRPARMHVELVSQFIKAGKQRDAWLFVRTLLGSPRQFYRRARGARREQLPP